MRVSIQNALEFSSLHKIYMYAIASHKCKWKLNNSKTAERYVQWIVKAKGTNFNIQIRGKRNCWAKSKWKIQYAMWCRDVLTRKRDKRKQRFWHDDAIQSNFIEPCTACDCSVCLCAQRTKLCASRHFPFADTMAEKNEYFDDKTRKVCDCNKTFPARLDDSYVAFDKIHNVNR